MPDGLPILHTLLAEREMRLARQACEQSLYEFVRFMWTAVEPETPFVGSWVLRAICQHLEAITNGYEDQETGEHEKLTRLSINVYPGATKSLLVAVFWPAWEWGPQNKPHLRYLCFAYAAHLTERDNRRFRQLVLHPRYRALWGYRFTLSGESIGQIVNDKSGWKLASSVGGVGTGERGDRVILDDANKPPTDADPIGESNATLKSTGAWFREILPDRLNSIERSAIVNMQQRTSDLDVSGIILDLGLPYEHLSIPMLLDTLPDRSGARRPIIETCLGWIDPRLRADWYEVEDDPEYDPWGPVVDQDELDARDGIIADPRRFPSEALNSLRTAKGAYAWASQYQQTVTPRGGGIILQEWWECWESVDFPEFGTCIASLDTSYKQHEEADYNALTVWCAFAHPDSGKPKLMLRDAWQKRCSLADLVRDVIKTCRDHKVDTLVIEDSARGTDVADEIYRLVGRASINIELVRPAGDKISRMNACVPIFENRIVYAPDKEWSDMVIRQVSNFPRASHDDLADTVSQALIYLRRTGVAVRREEHDDEIFERRRFRKQEAAIYDV